MSAATQYLEAAKIEELATELTAAGYKILNNDEDSKYDLVAMKDGKKIAIEVLPRSTLRSAETAENVGRLREEAYKQGYDEFRLVLVSPPRETTVAIDGLEAVLFNEMANHLPQELDELSTHTRLTDVNNVSIKSATVTASDLRVVGLGVVEVELGRVLR